MNSEELMVLSQRLAVMKRSHCSSVGLPVGEAPSNAADDYDGFWPQEELIHVSANSGTVFVGSDLSALESAASAAPTIAELEAAVQLDVDTMTDQQCLRALVKQNNVLIRDAMCRHRHPRPVRLRSDGGVICAGDVGGGCGSLNASLSASASGSNMISSESTSGSGGSPLSRISPPKSFVCPICCQPMNEKDFDRHVKEWNSKVGRSFFRSGQCPGIQSILHPLLSSFSVGTLADRVHLLVADIRSLLHPGAYDALSPAGSGRHVVVAARFLALGWSQP